MKEVILFSAGMDSHMMAHAYPNAELLFIDSGARYTEKELESIRSTAPRAVTVVRNVLDLSSYEREDAIVPARNLLLATVASYYGDRILIGSTAGDNSTDKDQEFADRTAELLSHIYNCGHFDRPSVEISLPFKEKSKLRLLRDYTQSNGDIQILINTTSCYSDVDGHCGECKACIRKWTAFEEFGIDIAHIFKKHPKAYDWDQIHKKLLAGESWRCADEDFYTLKVLRKYGRA